eukprot:1460800-Prymnesium_polylepis.1
MWEARGAARGHGSAHIVSMKKVKIGETKRASHAYAPKTSLGIKSVPANKPASTRIFASQKPRCKCVDDLVLHEVTSMRKPKKTAIVNEMR